LGGGVIVLGEHGVCKLPHDPRRKPGAKPPRILNHVQEKKKVKRKKRKKKKNQKEKRKEKKISYVNFSKTSPTRNFQDIPWLSIRAHLPECLYPARLYLLDYR